MDLAPQVERPPQRLPAYTQAAAALLRLSGQLFQLSYTCPSKDYQQNLQAWKRIRWTIRALVERGSMRLTRDEVFWLREAVKLCPGGEDRRFILAAEFDERGADRWTPAS